MGRGRGSTVGTANDFWSGDRVLDPYGYSLPTGSVGVSIM